MTDAVQGQATNSSAPAAQQPAAPSASDQRGVPDAVARVQAIIDREPGASPFKRSQPQAETTPAKEQVPAQPEAQPEPEAPAAPNKQTEGDDAPAEDARPVAEIPLDQLEAIELEVSVQGEKSKLPIKELREGYMRQADYSKKTAEISRQREQLVNETRTAAEAARVAALKELQAMHDLVEQVAEAELAGVNWKDLAQNNAFEYVRLDNRKKEITQAKEAIRSKQQEILQKHQAEQETVKREAAVKARAQLEADIPGWNDTLYQQLMKAGIEKFGFKQEEVVNWVDPRAIKLLHKAHLYDQLQADKTQPAADKKVVAVPKSVRPGTVQQVSQRQQQESTAMKRLQTTHSIADAAAVIKSRFGPQR